MAILNHRPANVVPRLSQIKPQTLPELFNRATNIYGANPLVHLADDNSVFSYADVREVVTSVCTKLIKMGVKSGDRIVVYSQFHIEAAFVFWASTAIGAVFAPVDYRSSAKAFQRIKDFVTPKVIFSDLKSISKIHQKYESIVIFDDEQIEFSSHQQFSQWLSSNTNSPDGKNELFKMDPFDLKKTPQVTENDTAAILFTSGTTADPKGVELSHGALLRSGQLFSETYQWKQSDLLLSLGELRSISGIRNPLIATLFSGNAFLAASNIAQKNVFSISQLIEQNRISLLATNPTFLRQFLSQKKRLAPSVLATVQQILSAGSPLDHGLLAEFEATFNTPIYNYYGLTETSGFCLGVNQTSINRNKETVGAPVGCSIQIVDSEGDLVKEGEVGELLISSNQLMKGYWRNIEQTNAIMLGKWLQTGDFARMNEEGEIIICGRKKEIIKDTMGDLIHPKEIESVLIKHPLVKHVAVHKEVSKNGDEFPVAFVVMRDNCEPDEILLSLQKFVKTELGENKIPRSIIIKKQLPQDYPNSIYPISLKRK